MILDSRDKMNRLSQFLNTLKLNKDIQPFLQTEDIFNFGIYDFCFVNKNPLTFSMIQQKVKEHKYKNQLLTSFTEELKQIFITVSDYCFGDDPIQGACEQFINQIDLFSQQFEAQFKYVPEDISFKTMTEDTSQIIEDSELEVKKERKATKEKKISKRSGQRIQKYEQASSSLSEKLKALFVLRDNEHNEPYIREIGTHFRIGEQTEHEYIISISDAIPYWKYLLHDYQ